jgi:hypothetical protein
VSCPKPRCTTSVKSDSYPNASTDRDNKVRDPKMVGQDYDELPNLNGPNSMLTVEPTLPRRPGVDTSKLGAKRVRLGEWLVRRSLISRYHLYQALNVVYHDSCRLGDALVQLGHMPRDGVEREAHAMDDTLAARRSELPPPNVTD